MAATKSGEAMTFAISMATAFYGASSEQVKVIKDGASSVFKTKSSQPEVALYGFATGCIADMVAQLNAGLVESVRLVVAGEVLADFLAMAQEALNEKSIPVAAVLTAAAFEDCLRRLAEEKAGVTARIKLELIISELKNQGVLSGGEPALAQGFLKFRNDSLHADWAQVNESQIAGCLGFLRPLILKHFS